MMQGEVNIKSFVLGVFMIFFLTRKDRSGLTQSVIRIFFENDFFGIILARGYNKKHV